MGVTAKLALPLIVGVNHRNASVTLRDRLFVDDTVVPVALEKLKEQEIAQALILSTCDRVEIITVSENLELDAQKVTSVLTEIGSLAPEEATVFSTSSGMDAVRYLFRIASSLESVVVGEPQILGQVKACHRLARNADMIGSELESLLQSSYATAKRVRTETAIGERPVSIAAVATGIARDVHGRLDHAHALILGRGDMGEVIGGELIRAGIGGLSVADAAGRTSRELAAQLRARHIEESDLSRALVDADIIVTAVGGRSTFLSADMVQSALKLRRHRPQFIVDASLPSDVEPSVDRLDDAFMYDLQDLERLALEGLENRVSEADAATFIIDEEVARYINSRKERKATPALNALRAHVVRLREQVLLEADGDAERATHMLVQRLLHTPSEKLRAKAAAGENIDTAERLIRDLFDIIEDEENTK